MEASAREGRVRFDASQGPRIVGPNDGEYVGRSSPRATRVRSRGREKATDPTRSDHSSPVTGVNEY